MSKLIIIKIGNKLLGIPAKDIKEIVEIPKVFPSPFVMKSVKGTAFWRGAVLTVVSLNSIINERTDGDSFVYVRLALFSNILIEADKVVDIIEYNELKLDEKGGESIFKGIYFYGERSVSVLDTGKLSFAIEEEVIGTLRYGVNWR